MSKWYRSVNCIPGFTDESIKAVKVKCDLMKESGKTLVCGLIMDEMAIREHLQWNGKRHQGYITVGADIDSYDNLPKAKDVLVFLLVALNSRWKVPVGYFFINGLSANQRANLVNECLNQIHNTGVVIKTLTFDGAASNIAMANILGARLQWPNLKPYFPHPKTNDNVYIMLDACHMIKLCRNTLGDWGIIHDGDGNQVKWEYFKNLVHLQNEAGLHAATKIRNRHINYKNEKMKVKLAVQTFSSSVSDAIDYCREDLKLKQFKGSEATSKFCRILNNVFDVLNTRNMLGKTTFNRPLNSENLTFIKDFEAEVHSYIEKLKDNFNGRRLILSPRKTGFVGLLICLKSIVLCFQDMLDKDMLSFLLTYKLSQDHIEMFFSAVRSRGGFNNNPSAAQFEAAFKRLLVHTEILTPTSANCLAQDNTSILNVSSAQINEDFLDTLMETKQNQCTDEDEEQDVAHHAIPIFSDYIDDVVTYIAGFVARKVETSIRCSECSRVLRSDNSLSALLNRKNRGRLIKASQDVVIICKAAEKTIRSATQSKRLLPHLTRTTISLINNNNNLCRQLNEHFLQQDPLNNHYTQLIILILKTYFTIRIHHINSSENEIKNRIRHTNTKIVHFYHQ